jgi:hypothetical protein
MSKGIIEILCAKLTAGMFKVKTPEAVRKPVPLLTAGKLLFEK